MSPPYIKEATLCERRSQRSESLSYNHLYSAKQNESTLPSKKNKMKPIPSNTSSIGTKESSPYKQSPFYYTAMNILSTKQSPVYNQADQNNLPSTDMEGRAKTKQ